MQLNCSNETNDYLLATNTFRSIYRTESLLTNIDFQVCVSARINTLITILYEFWPSPFMFISLMINMSSYFYIILKKKAIAFQRCIAFDVSLKKKYFNSRTFCREIPITPFFENSTNRSLMFRRELIRKCIFNCVIAYGVFS